MLCTVDERLFFPLHFTSVIAFHAVNNATNLKHQRGIPHLLPLHYAPLSLLYVILLRFYSNCIHLIRLQRQFG
jgi:hypothetical protein